MKIIGIEAFPFRLPLRRQFRWASLRIDLGGFVFVRIRTDEGLSGIGEATPLPDWGGDFHRRGGETQKTVVEMIDSVIAPALEDMDPTDIAACHLAIDKVLRGNSYAKVAVDIALHDLWGKALGQPLYKLLGGKVRDRVPVAHMIGIMPNDDAVEEGVQAHGDGIRAFQVKGGEDSDRDIDLIRRLRETLGEGTILRLDINQGYRDIKEAVSVIEALGDAGLDYVEQPATGLDRMAAITAAVRPRIIADESCWDARDAMEIIQQRAADNLSIYLAKAGGIYKARRVAAVAASSLVDYDVNGSIESAIGTAANVHFALAEPCVTMPCVISVNAPEGAHPCQAGGHYYRDDVITEPLPFADGALLPLDKPGLGIEIDEARLESFRED